MRHGPILRAVRRGKHHLIISRVTRLHDVCVPKGMFTCGTRLQMVQVFAIHHRNLLSSPLLQKRNASVLSQTLRRSCSMMHGEAITTVLYPTASCRTPRMVCTHPTLIFAFFGTFRQTERVPRGWKVGARASSISIAWLS